jgi:large subunit ribosomal protein L22
MADTTTKKKPAVKAAVKAAKAPEQFVVRSYAKGVDIAPRKVSIVAALVRNRTVADALVILDHVPRRSAVPVKKAIQSAVANATNNHGLDGKTLIISTLSVTVGKRLKRFKPHMRGMALPFQKISTNILVEVSGTEKPAKKPIAKTTKVKETK